MVPRLLAAILATALVSCAGAEDPGPAGATDDDDAWTLDDDDDSAADDDDSATDDDDSATDDDDSAADDDDSAAPPPDPIGGYLVLAADGLAEAGEGYAALRADQQLATAVVSVTDLVAPGYTTEELVEAVHGQLEALADPLPEDAALYLLLLGDAPLLGEDPAGLIPASPCENLLGDCYTDNTYGDLDGDGVPEAAVGRVPARTPDEAAAYLDKVAQFEADRQPGLWNRRLVVFAGDSGFGPDFDAIAESVILDSLALVNHSFDVWGVWNNPASDYYYVPFTDKVVDLFDQGAVAAFYIGHGSSAYNDALSQTQLDAMVLDDRPPFAFFFACSNGSYAGDAGSISEAVLWQPGGPIAAFAASDLTHPYANAIYPYEMQRALFDALPSTFGQAIRLAKIASIENQDETRDVMEAFAALSGVTDEEMATIERETLDLYNLLGDPALPTLYAPGAVEFDAVVGAVADGHVDVSGWTPNVQTGSAFVTLEVDANQHLGLLDPDRDDPAVINSNWAIANDRLAAQLDVPVVNGRFEASLDFDPDLPGDAWFIKVYADDGEQDAFGHRAVP